MVNWGRLFKKSESDSDSPLPWESDLQGLQFIKIEHLVSLQEIEVEPKCLATYSRQHIVFTVNHGLSNGLTFSHITIYNLATRTIRESSWYASHGAVSPDGDIFIRWRYPTNESARCIIEAIRLDRKALLASSKLERRSVLDDVNAITWVNESTVYIPDSRQKIVIRWFIDESGNHERVITPLAAISAHQFLRFHITRDEKWWVINGMSMDGHIGGTGHLEIQNAGQGGRRSMSGFLCCIAEVNVYDEEKALLVIADVDKGKLLFKVQQLDPNAPGKHIEPVDVSVKRLDPKALPCSIMVFEHLPIAVIATTDHTLYFFDLHTGAYLYSQTMKAYQVLQGPTLGRDVVMKTKDGKDVYRMSINTEDLIKYVRLVLKNDILASGIAIRAGLSGAEDIVLDEMHADYRDIPTELKLSAKANEIWN